MKIIETAPNWDEPVPEAAENMKRANLYLLWITILLDVVSLWVVLLLMNVISMSTVWALMSLVGIKLAVLIAAMVPPKKRCTVQ